MGMAAPRRCRGMARLTGFSSARGARFVVSCRGCYSEELDLLKCARITTICDDICAEG